eukprot:CAMPEP_0201735832 /NCGR_PEP_ID=MMETSP0593-20130828/38114_1 /ASSEMBLY_ACC=CAM_ASM_000672 /TAXON_ID=267983 /ORGANISM="Skeletonema japonicum, Strain CCMP2506" /LENGTH=337 /DNA_ID=CAMNT_0048229455 /DNA_START=1304 /DNA_END=2314 /DNA_ORIENTATION=-
MCQDKSNDNTASSKWTVHDTCQNCSLLPTLGVTLFLGWNAILFFIMIYSVFVASKRERVFILALCLLSLVLPPRWPGPIGRQIGWWMIAQSEKYFGLKTIVEDEQALLKVSEGNRGAIYAMEPHDVLPFAAFSFNPIINRIPGGRNICFMVSSSVFRVPFLRQVYSWAGSLPVDKETFLSRLSAGKAVAFVPGGVHECFLLDPKKPRDLVLYLRNRKGFIKLALQTGSPIVPVFSFHVKGSYTYYWQPRGRLLEAWSRWAGYIPLLFFGRWNIPLFIPRANKLTVVIGRPIHIPKEGSHVSRDIVDKYHEMFLKEMEALFERHKKIEGYGDTHVKIV